MVAIKHLQVIQLRLSTMPKLSWLLRRTPRAPDLIFENLIGLRVMVLLRLSTVIVVRDSVGHSLPFPFVCFRFPGSKPILRVRLFISVFFSWAYFLHWLIICIWILYIFNMLLFVNVQSFLLHRLLIVWVVQVREVWRGEGIVGILLVIGLCYFDVFSIVSAGLILVASYCRNDLTS